MISGPRVRQAREAKGLTQIETAEMLDVPQAVLSKIETGAREVSREEAIRLANALDVPLRFLIHDPLCLPDGSLGLFRSVKTKVRRQDYLKARRLAEIGAEAVLKLCDGAPVPANRIEVLGGDPEEAAVHARNMLRLSPDEPIGNLTYALERSGAIVLRLSLENEHISGFGAWLDPVPGLTSVARPMLVTRRPLGPFRLRFTLGHELGHIVLGHQVFSGPQKPEERDANLFSQALFMPRDPALEDLTATPLSVDRLAELKGKWGMSMNAIAMRAKHLGVIDERGYRSVYENLRFRGWLKLEPGDIETPAEAPRLLRELAARRKLDYSVYDVAGALDLGLDQVKAIIGQDRGLDILSGR